MKVRGGDEWRITNVQLLGIPPDSARVCEHALSLATWAEVAAAAANDQTPDRPATAAARLARSLINAESGPVFARFPLDIDIVAEAGPLELDRVIEDLLHSLQEATDD